MTKTLTLETIRRGMIVRLAIPACRPILTLSGVLHQAEQDYKILGTHGTVVRLSRVSDCAKLMMVAEDLYLAPAGEAAVRKLNALVAGLDRAIAANRA